jgi:hypothetical protein
MKLGNGWRATVEVLAAMIAHSQIVLTQPAEPTPPLPAGFDEIDIAVLEWIAAEGRRLGRSPLQM